MNWDKNLNYGKIARKERPRLANLLDELQEIYPIPTYEDRYSRIRQWLEGAKKEGLLNDKEVWELMPWIANNM